MSPPDFSGTYGSLLVGGLVAAVLYGITALQTVVYCQHSATRDGWLIKITVGSLWLVDTFDMAAISQLIYWYLITNFGNPSSFSQPVV
ncbi:uncharacterized protein PHACADRAFT_197410 [Phanerochaete carnosa HHB-10118-sp]|uniref:Uncharacterized protein n=1 Tax=Phanerochaete carnosa (strain HHB-10118-sp) TaxID=650164 RepID=K5VNE4_PHACS|nr:uncharacterized protein PHACADRAFT_197410 [Phanerochaete carnosa HHB-10118-sp]EKM52978.1 hypothetical protein PHACADRAFT_197410 [Phanerochaete carnosa HHB-10118-sp]